MEQLIFRFVRYEQCPICQKQILAYFEKGIVLNHNGYDYLNRNILVRDCVTLKKAEEVKKSEGGIRDTDLPRKSYGRKSTEDYLHV